MASSSTFITNRICTSKNPLVPLTVSKSSPLFQTQIIHTNSVLKFKPLLKATSEEPSEMLEEDSKFVPLTTDDSSFGPPIQKFLKELEGEFLEVVFCTEDMLTGSLWEAINTKQPNLEASKIAKALPRICFLSGLTGEEMMMFIDAFPESGLAGTVFAAVVPNSADKPLLEVMEEIMGDHEMMNHESTLFTLAPPWEVDGIQYRRSYRGE